MRTNFLLASSSILSAFLLRLSSAGTAAAICLLTASTGWGRDRLYVIVSRLDSAGASAIVAFDVDAQGLLTQRESYPTGGLGHGMSSDQDLTLHPSGRLLFAPNNASSSVSVFGIATNVPGQPGTTTYTDPNAVGAGPIFYRVGVGD